MKLHVRHRLQAIQEARWAKVDDFAAARVQNDLILEQPEEPTLTPLRREEIRLNPTMMGLPLYLATRFWTPPSPAMDPHPSNKTFANSVMKATMSREQLPLPTATLEEMQAWMATTRWSPKSYTAYYKYPGGNNKYYTVRQHPFHGEIIITQYLPHLSHESRFTTQELTALIETLMPLFPDAPRYKIVFYQGSSLHDNMNLVISDDEVKVTDIRNIGSKKEAKRIA